MKKRVEQNVIILNQETTIKVRPEEAGPNTWGIQIFHSFLEYIIGANQVLKFYSSLDSPKTGSGDHENVYSGVSNNIEIHDPNGKIYDDCVKKAVHIRETLSHIPWHSSRNSMVFSDLSNSTN